MKYDTLKDIAILRKIMQEKQDRIDALETRLKKIHNLIPVMGEKAKEEALKEAKELEAEHSELRKYIADAKKRIDAFYAPASKIA